MSSATVSGCSSITPSTPVPPNEPIPAAAPMALMSVFDSLGSYALAGRVQVPAANGVASADLVIKTILQAGADLAQAIFSVVSMRISTNQSKGGDGTAVCAMAPSGRPEFHAPLYFGSKTPRQSSGSRRSSSAMACTDRFLVKPRYPDAGGEWGL